MAAPTREQVQVTRLPDGQALLCLGELTALAWVDGPTTVVYFDEAVSRAVATAPTTSARTPKCSLGPPGRPSG